MAKKSHNVVIMDGSNKDVVRDIMRRMSYAIGSRNIRIDTLDSDHPSTIVLGYRASTEESWGVEEEVELKYPGLCNFDVAV